METSKERVKIESMDVRVSNAADENRRHAISVTAHIEGGKLAYLHYGNIAALPAGDGPEGEQLADFDTWNGGNLSVQFRTPGKRSELLSEVEDFVEAVLADEAVMSIVEPFAEG